MRNHRALSIHTKNRRPRAAAVESLEPRLLMSVVRTINGRVFFDSRDKGHFLPKDHWMAGVEVFLDLNGNGVLDAGEPSTVTNKVGAFSFKKLPRGTYDVVVVPPAGDAGTNPADDVIVAVVVKHSLLSLRFGLHTAPDVTPPAAALSASALSTTGMSPYQFTVTWTDATAVEASSLGDGNIAVTAADGYDQLAQLVSVNPTGNGSPLSAAYQIPAPIASWTSDDNGTYTVTLEGGQVSDTLGNIDPTMSLGTFMVSIPSIDPDAPALLGGTNGITPHNNSLGSLISFEVTNTTPGSTLTLMADGTAIGSALASSTETEITSTGTLVLADGAHQFVIDETLPGGMQADSAPATVTVDTTAPTADLSAPPLTAIGTSTYDFTITWSDATAVSAASLAGQDLVVTAAGGFSQTPTLLSLDANVDGPTRIATYQLTAPGGTWTAANDGTYTVKLLPGLAMDEVGNADHGGSLGTFTVAVGMEASAAPGVPTLAPASDTGAFDNDNITDLNNSSPARALRVDVPGTDSGADVLLYSDGTLIASGTATGSSIVLTTNGSTTLADGTHLLTARQTDPGHAQSAASAATGVYVETQPPTATSTPPSVNAIGATSYSFSVVYQDSLALNVQKFATGNVIVTGPNGFSSLGTLDSVNAPGDGSPRTVTYSITPPGGSWQPADNGTYSVKMQGGQVFDIAGNAVPAATVATFNVSANLPASPTPLAPALLPASDSGISSSDGLTNLNNSSVPAELQFSVGGTTSGAAVTLYSDGTLIGSSNAGGATTIITTSGTTTLPDGPHTITARQTVAGDGQSPDSTSTTVTIDTAPPIASSLSAATVNSAGATTYTFTVTFTDIQAVNVATLDDTDVTVSPPGGGTIAAAFVSANPNANGTPIVATYSITPPGGSWDPDDNGTYTVNLQAGQVGDTTGNIAAAATVGQFTVNVPLPLSPTPNSPALLPASDTGVSSSDGVTNLNNSSHSKELQFSVGGTIAGATVYLDGGGGVIGSAVAAGSTTVITTNGTLTLADGTHHIMASQTVPGDAESAKATGAAIIIDTTPPTATSLSASAVGSSASGATSYTFTVTYADSVAVNVASLGGGDVTVTPSGGSAIAAAFVSANPNSSGTPIVATYSITPPGGSWTSADNGTYTVNLLAGQVSDTAGNTANAATLGQFSVNVPAPVTATPAAPVLAAASTTGVSPNLTNLNNTSSGAALQFTVGSTLNGATVTVYSDDVAIGSAVASGATTTVTTNGSTSLTDGSHNITARQQLSGLTQSPDSAALGITVDTEPPTASANTSGVTASGATTYTFTVTFTDEVAINTATLQGNAILVTGPNGFSAPATYVSIDVSSNGTPRTATYQITPPNGSWDMSANGVYTIALQPNEVFDTAGNAAVSATIGTFNVNIPMGG